MNDLVFVKDNKLTTESLKVAEMFRKDHSKVLKAIKNLDSSSSFNEANFSLVNYKDAKGELRPSYEITRDGFMFLVMGFTGKKAAVAKEAFIKAFNIMEAELNKPSMLSPLEVLAQVAQALADQQNNMSLMDNRLTKIEKDKKEAEQQLSLIPLDNIGTPPEEMTTRKKLNALIRGFARINEKPIGEVWAKLYHEFIYVYEVNLQARSKHRELKTLDYAEEEGFIPDLFRMAVKLFRDK